MLTGPAQASYVNIGDNWYTASIKIYSVKIKIVNLLKLDCSIITYLWIRVAKMENSGQEIMLDIDLGNLKKNNNYRILVCPVVHCCEERFIY